ERRVPRPWCFSRLQLSRPCRYPRASRALVVGGRAVDALAPAVEGGNEAVAIGLAVGVVVGLRGPRGQGGVQLRRSQPGFPAPVNQGAGIGPTHGLFSG